MTSEKRRAWKRAWKKKNREKENTYQRAHRAAHPELYAKYEKRRREKVKSDPTLLKARRARHARWRRANPEKHAEQRKKDNRAYAIRRAKRLLFRGTRTKFLKARLFQKQKGFCKLCRIDLRLSGSQLDHIIPVSKGGSNLDYNFQLLCPTCNVQKSNHLMVL